MSLYCREFASHGYMVFAPDSTAGCSGYTERKCGKPILYDYYRSFTDPIRKV